MLKDSVANHDAFRWRVMKLFSEIESEIVKMEGTPQEQAGFTLDLIDGIQRSLQLRYDTIDSILRTYGGSDAI